MTQAAYFQTAFEFADTVSTFPELRDYQQAALRAVLHHVGNRVRRQLVVLPTGTGKSVVFRHIPAVLEWERTLVLVHRIELVEQAARHLIESNPGLLVEIERADYRATDKANIVVACVPTLRGDRLKRWRPKHFDGIIMDEVHHAMAKSWTSILRHFGTNLPGGPTVVGFTATPFRGDGKPLANLFDEIVFSRDIREMIEGGWLTNLRAMRLHTNTDISNLHTKYGEFRDDELGQLANTDGRNSLVVSGIETHCKDRNAIMVFCVNVEHTESLTAALIERGHAAACVLGHTPMLERGRNLRDFKSGGLRIMVTCGVLSEGVDIPRADCAVLARPWKSPLGYIQQVGRVLRPHPDKQDALIMDVVDIVGTHTIQTATSLFGKRDFDVLGRDVLAAVKQIEKAEEVGILLDDGMSVDAVEERAAKIERIAKGIAIIPTEAEAIDVFHAAVIPSDVQAMSAFPWIKTGPDTWTVRLKGAERMMLTGDALGNWAVHHHPTGGIRPLGLSANPPWKLADRAVKDAAPEFWRVKRMEAKWRRHPASDGQRTTLHKMGFHALPRNLTKGAASDMMDVVFTRRTHHAKGR